MLPLGFARWKASEVFVFVAIVKRTVTLIYFLCFVAFDISCSTPMGKESTEANPETNAVRLYLRLPLQSSRAKIGVDKPKALCENTVVTPRALSFFSESGLFQRRDHYNADRTVRLRKKTLPH